MAAKVSTKYKPARAEEFNAAMALVGRSSCTQPHDSRPKRQRSRKDAKRAAIKAGW